MAPTSCPLRASSYLGGASPATPRRIFAADSPWLLSVFHTLCATLIARRVAGHSHSPPRSRRRGGRVGGRVGAGGVRKRSGSVGPAVNQWGPPGVSSLSEGADGVVAARQDARRAVTVPGAEQGDGDPGDVADGVMEADTRSRFGLRQPTAREPCAARRQGADRNRAGERGRQEERREPVGLKLLEGGLRDGSWRGHQGSRGPAPRVAQNATQVAPLDRGDSGHHAGCHTPHHRHIASPPTHEERTWRQG